MMSFAEQIKEVTKVLIHLQDAYIALENQNKELNSKLEEKTRLLQSASDKNQHLIKELKKARQKNKKLKKLYEKDVPPKLPHEVAIPLHGWF